MGTPLMPNLAAVLLRRNVDWLQLSNMTLIILSSSVAGIICIGFAVAAGDDGGDEEIDTGGRSKALNGVLAISIGLGAPISIAIQHFFIRKFSGVYSGLAQAFDVAPVQNGIFCFFMLQLQDKLTVTWEDIFVGGAAGTMMETARVLISYTLKAGCGSAEIRCTISFPDSKMCGACRQKSGEQ